jgi:V/A-type H+-transporting ATPase subunit I
MAIVNMKRLALVGLSAEREKILKTLHRLGCVELSTAEKSDNTHTFTDAALIDKLETKLNRINFYFSFLKEMKVQALKLSSKYEKLYDGKKPQIAQITGDKAVITRALADYTPAKKPFVIGLPSIAYDAFDSIIEKEEELFEMISKAEALNSELIDIKSDSIRLISLMEQLAPYAEVDAKFSSIKDSAHVTFMLGLIPSNKLTVIDGIIEAFPDAEIIYFTDNKFSVVFVAAPLSMKEDILNRLTEADYTPSSFKYDINAKEKLAELEREKFVLEVNKERIVLEATGLEIGMSDIKTLYDYYLLELKKAEADESFRFTESSFTLEGWFPGEIEEKLTAILNKDFTVYIEIREAREEEAVPTLNRNNKFVTPYQDITNMYSVPNYREIDPNPIMAIFYFIFFGIMVSDAGYGLILTAVTLVLLKILKPKHGSGNLLFIICMGGISTFVWGVMFGGWFGVTWHPLLFDPINSAIPMLGLCLGLGVVHIMFGMGIKAVALFKEKKYLDAICNVFGWYALFIGLGLLVLPATKTFGMIIALIGFAGVLIGGGIGKKGILKKIVGGFANIYGITGYMSDILSYSRLFGLGLATGVVGLVFNQLAELVSDMVPYVGIVFAIVILIIGHTFNKAINTLGAYVHNSRLQYIEFFSKFYTGAGHQFVPFGSKTKYVYIDN